MSAKLKTDFKGDIRVLRQTGEIRDCYNALFQHVIDCYGFKDIKEFDLRYVDEEQDNVTITSIADLEDAISCAKSEGKAVKIFVVSKDGEKNEEEKEEPEPEKPEIRPFFVEMKENEAFRKEFILLLENVLKHVRNSDDNRNLSEALKDCIKNHTLITSHPDFNQFLPFLEMGAIHMQPYAVFFAAIDPTYVHEIVEFIVGKIDDGCVRPCQIFPLFRMFRMMKCHQRRQKFERLGSSKCICGDALTMKPAKECYDTPKSTVFCDGCNAMFTGDSKIYHCPKGKTDKHPNGHDFCVNCAKSDEVLCNCGEVMVISTPNAAYPRGPVQVFCDICHCRCDADSLVYHCMKKKAPEHFHGYDVCMKCFSKSASKEVESGDCEKPKRRCGGGSFRRNKGCFKSAGTKEGEKPKQRRWGKMKDATLEQRQERLNAKLLRLKQKLSEIDALAAEKKQPKKEKECQTDCSNKNNSNECDEIKPSIEKEKAVIEKVVSNSVESGNSPLLVISDVSHVSNVNKDDESMIRGVSPKDILNIPQTFENNYVFANQLQQLMGMGFDEVRAKEALNKFKGDVSKAANFLLR